jgi:uncharacterized protein
VDIKQSPLVQLASEAKRPTRWWVGWLVTFLLGVMGIQIVSVFVTAGMNIVHGTAAAQWAELVTNLGTLAVLALWVVLKEGRRFSSVGLTHPAKGLPQLGVGIAVGVGLFLVPTGLLLAFGQYEVVAPGAGQRDGLAALPLVLALVLVWLVQGSTEEIVVRGYLLQIHGQQLPAWVAVLVTSVGFALAHLGAGPVALVNISLIAIFFAFISLRRGSIWLASGIHVGWNYAQGNLLGIPVSGSARDTALVFLGPTPGAPEMISGGRYGIEGSLIATALLATLAVWSFVDYRKHQLPVSSATLDEAPAPGESEPVPDVPGTAGS